MARMAKRVEIPGAAGERVMRGLAWLARLPWGSALFALVAYGAFVVLRAQTLGGDISRFVTAGDTFIPVATGAHVGLSVLPHSDGYDGQFYYLLSLDPFSPHAALPGAHYDAPAYRAQRILYPLIVWAVTLGGHARFVPLALVVVNLAAIVAIAVCGAFAARRLGLDPMLGTMVAFYPGLLLSLARDLGEPVGIAFALGGLVCALDRRWLWAGALLSLAVLARETTALFPLALLLVALLAGLSRRVRLPGGLRLLPPEEWRGAALAGLAPLVVVVGWQVVLILHWGQIGLQGGGHNFGWPFAGILQAPHVWQTTGWPGYLVDTHYLEGLYLAALALLTAFTVWTQRRADNVALAWAAYLLMSVCLTILVWLEDWSFLRTVVEFGVSSLFILISARWAVRAFALLATMCVWGAVFLAHLPK